MSRLIMKAICKTWTTMDDNWWLNSYAIQFMSCFSWLLAALWPSHFQPNKGQCLQDNCASSFWLCGTGPYRVTQCSHQRVLIAWDNVHRAFYVCIWVTISWHELCLYTAWHELCLYSAWNELCVYTAWSELCLYATWNELCVYTAWNELCLYSAWTELCLYTDSSFHWLVTHILGMANRMMITIVRPIAIRICMIYRHTSC